jgi:hypothetical protein
MASSPDKYIVKLRWNLSKTFLPETHEPVLGWFPLERGERKFRVVIFAKQDNTWYDDEQGGQFYEPLYWCHISDPVLMMFQDKSKKINKRVKTSQSQHL